MSAVYLNFDDFFGLLKGSQGRIIGRYGKGYGSTLFNNRYMQPNPTESNAFLDDSAGIDSDDTSGLTYGMQMEVWF
jgi:hypothetical protein